MMEKPVSRPMVPPMADSWSTNLAARSFNELSLNKLVPNLTYFLDVVKSRRGNGDLHELKFAFEC